MRVPTLITTCTYTDNYVYLHETMRVPTLITVCIYTHYCDHVVAILRVLARCFNVEIIPVCEGGCEVDIVSTDIIIEFT
jgi:hypothetical protein